jgi:hypothetical protein
MRLNPSHRKPRKPRKPRGRAVVAATEALLASPTAALIDKHTGLPDGERILQALAVLAMGKPEEIAKFFGWSMRMRPRDRQAALEVLEQRRFGKVPQIDQSVSEHPPTTIVNVFATSEEFAFVTQAEPLAVPNQRTLPVPLTGDKR